MDLANVLELLSKKGFIQEVDIQTIIEDEDFKESKTKKKKKSTEERAGVYDPTKCDARIWLKGGFAAQCSCAKVDGQFFCKKHQNEADSHGGVTKNGSFNGERPTHHYGDESEKLIPWHDVTPVKPKKGEKLVKMTYKGCPKWA